MPRWSISVLLLAIGLGSAVIAIAVRADVAMLSIFVGVASTAVASGLVDLFAVLERRRVERPLRQLAARRIGRVHQLLISIIQTVFPDLQADTAASWPDVLRNAPEGVLDFAEDAGIAPPRSRAEHLRELLAELERTQVELAALATAGVLAAETNAVDTELKGFFLSAIGVSVGFPTMESRRVLAADAADLLKGIQAIVPSAQKAAGASWTYGTL